MANMTNSNTKIIRLSSGKIVIRESLSTTPSIAKAIATPSQAKGN